MITIDFFGPDSDFLRAAFYNSGGTLTANVVSGSATEFVLSNPLTGYDTLFEGTGFTFDADGLPTGGQLVTISVESGLFPVAVIEVPDLNLAEVFDAIEAGLDSLQALISETPVTFDRTFSTSSVSHDFSWLTSDLTFVAAGSDVGLSVTGGQGNDHIDPGPNFFGNDEIRLSPGNDTVDFGQATEFSTYIVAPGPDVASGLRYAFFGSSASARVTFEGGNTLLRDIAASRGGGEAAVFDGNPVTFVGTGFDDRFIVSNTTDDGFVRVSGGDGADTYIISPGSGVSIHFSTQFFPYNTATQADVETGIFLNLDRRIVFDDGYGNRDRILISGNEANLQIWATDFDDRLVGNAEDNFFVTGAGSDTIVGGDGFDTVQFDSIDGLPGVSVNLAVNRAVVDQTGGPLTSRLVGIEAVIGTRGGDLLVGDAVGNELSGLGGNDTLNGAAGDDTIFGGTGDDLILAGPGGDIIDGGTGRDTLTYFGDNSVTVDLAFNGQNAGAAVGDTIDAIEAVVGSRADDILRGDFRDETLEGLAGNDDILGRDGDDTLLGNGGADTLTGAAGDDLLQGGSGLDRLNGGIGADTLDGGLGADVLLGGDGRDSLDGHDGRDTLFGGNGADFLSGGDQGDRLVGNAGADTLLGGGGNDTLLGGSGNDILTGGENGDTFVFSGTTGADVITDFDLGPDALRIAAALVNGEQDAATAIAAVGRIENGNAILDFGDGNQVTVTGVASLSDLALDVTIF